MAPHLKVHLASRDETVEERDVFALRAGATIDTMNGIYAEVGMYPSRLFLHGPDAFTTFCNEMAAEVHYALSRNPQISCYLVVDSLGCKMYRKRIRKATVEQDLRGILAFFEMMC